MATLTIRGLDDDLKRRLRIEAARRGHSMEETARQILRKALSGSEREARGLGTLVHSHFAEVGEFDLDLPTRSVPRPAPDLADDRPLDDQG